MSDDMTPGSQECAHMLQHVYEFLDHELDTATSDEIRQHLAGCEPCLDRFDLEQAVKSLVSRSCGSDVAPPALRTKVMDRLAAAKKAAYLGSDGFGPSA